MSQETIQINEANKYSTKDIVLKTEEVVSSSYLSKKGQTYKELGTQASDWSAAKIKGYLPGRKGQMMPIYDIPEEYSNPETSAGGVINNGFTICSKCQLCGHGIFNIHIVINHKTKMYLEVGSECVHNNYGKVITKKIKTYQDNKIRKHFKKLAPKFVEFMKKYNRNLPKGISQQQRDYVIRNKRMEYHMWRLCNELEDIDAETTGVRKLKNRIKTNSKKKIKRT